MRVLRLALLPVVCLVVATSLSAQQSSSASSATSDPQAVALIQRSLAALNAEGPITDVTLAGTVTSNFHSVTKSGTIRLVATASGQSEVASTFSSGTRTEIRDISTGTPSLIVSGPDGVPHRVKTQSAISPNPSWFFPAFILNEALSDSVYKSIYVGTEVFGGTSVQHLRLIPLPTNVSYAAYPSNLTGHDIYLDSTSLLPVAVTFNAHPYEMKNPNATLRAHRGHSVDRLEEVQFSDYQIIQGHPVALHLHTVIKLPFGPVVTDIQISSVELNTGATVSAN